MTFGRNQGMKCLVEEDRMGHLTVTFADTTSIYLQSEYEIAQFGVTCGIIEAPENWSGVPHHLSDNWREADFEDITSCPDYYKNSAE